MKNEKQIIVSINSIVLFIVCILPCIIILLIGSVSGLFFMFPLCVALYISLHFVLKLGFNEYLTVENGTILYHDSWFNNKKESKLNINDLKEILIENESFTSGPGSRNSVYLVDSSFNKTPLMLYKVKWFLSINLSLLNDIAQRFDVPIIEKKYVLDSDLKNRREA